MFIYSEKQSICSNYSDSSTDLPLYLAFVHRYNAYHEVDTYTCTVLQCSPEIHFKTTVIREINMSLKKGRHFVLCYKMLGANRVCRNSFIEIPIFDALF